MELIGRHVLITGASRGIGAAMARRFAAKGGRVSLVARDLGRLEELAEELKGDVFPADLSNQREVNDLINRVEEGAGPIDVLVNNAGMATTAWLTDLDGEEIRAVARLNLEAPMVLTAQVLPGMLARGRGHLVYTSSLAGTGGFPGLTVYGATKAGLSNFVAALRLELKGTNIGTTLVAPGPVETAMLDQLDGESSLAPTMLRLRQLQLIPTKSPDRLAQRTVSAVIAGRRHVRSPRRLSVHFWLREVPTRMTEAALMGVQTGPQSRRQ